MLRVASSRSGKYTIKVRLPEFLCIYSFQRNIIVNFTGEEFAKLDKVIVNQMYGGGKASVQSSIIYQHACVLWPDATPDDVTMRTLGAWAISQYRCNGSWINFFQEYARYMSSCPCFSFMSKQVRLDFTKRDKSAPEETGVLTPSTNNPTRPTGEPPRNKLGYVQPGHGSDDVHPLGGAGVDDSEIRAMRQDRIVENVAGIGVVGQSMDPTTSKQIVGVVALPVTEPPNVYAREANNVDSAIHNRITMQQRPFTANAEDKELLGRMVHEAIGNDPRRSLFSAKRVGAWWEQRVFNDLKSGKWTDDRLSRAIEGLCRRIDPGFRLKCDIKLEPMQEGKAPRMLIADQDEGQILSLLTICCIEDLIKKHFPNKTIKGRSKRDAMEVISKELRVPNTAYERTNQKCNSKAPPGLGPQATVFEGDGKAWDTTCSAELRAHVENPVIYHVAAVLKTLMVQPDSWVDAHSDISGFTKLTMLFSRNDEFKKYIIDAIRRSGHRGTSCLNWWVNYVCWHCAIFEKPETFLDPTARYGRDHTGVYRWLASGFEGDDSALTTTPKIEKGGALHVSILQRWERLGFNMEIFICDKYAKFTGYYMALDANGPTGVLMPEVDKCFSRAGVSTSPTMVECFKRGDRAGCMAISKSSALAKAYEYAGCSPTVSSKFLRFYDTLPGKARVDRELQMRTCGGDAVFSEPDVVAQIHYRNGVAMNFDGGELARFKAVGFDCTDEELTNFSLRIWDYDVLKDWEGFRASLPETWRVARPASH